jgi:hypothetical protein
VAEFNKAIIALAMAILVIIDQLWGIRLGAITEESVTIILAVLTPVLVWLVPNWPAQRRTP